MTKTCSQFVRFVCVFALATWIGGGARAQTQKKPSKTGKPVFEIAYTVEPRLEATPPHLSVELTFRGNSDGKTTLNLPLQWAGHFELYKGITDLRVLSPDANLTDTDAPHQKTVTHQPNQDLKIQYKLVQMRTEKLSGRNSYHAVVQPSHFFGIGHAWLVHPDRPRGETARVTFEWRDMNPRWTFGDSFGVKQAKQTETMNLGTMLHAAYFAGDFRLHQARVHGKSVFVALRGDWKFRDEDMVTAATRIIEVEREFWNDFDFPRFLITLVPMDSETGDYGGTALADSFCLFCAKDFSPESTVFKWLIAHEYFHTWNTQRIGRLEDPEQLMYWFSEGFTDYYARALLLRAGLITPKEYLDDLNEKIRDYYLSPVRNADNERIRNDFFNDKNGEVSKLPYRRGDLLAHRWDALIRKHSNGKRSLDDIMRDIFRAAKSAKGKPSAVTPETILAGVKRYAGRDVRDDYERFIVKGETFDFASDLGPHLSASSADVERFELGCDLDTVVKHRKIAGVVPGGTAHQAGLRDGQEIVKRKPIYVGDPTKAVEMRVRDAEGEKDVTYLPAGNPVKVPQFKLNENLAKTAPEAYRKWFGMRAAKK